MNYYLVYRTDSIGYEEYDSFVVSAETAEEAKQYNPSGYEDSGSWPSRSIKVTYLGPCGNPDFIKPGTVVCASFNAG